MKKEDKNGWILVIDSGSGGLFTLNKIKAVLPNENYIFYKDIKNCPYGNKTRFKLRKISFKIISDVQEKYTLKMVVLACNTLSSICLSYLQKKFPNLPIIATLPMLDDNILSKPTLILATKNTIKFNRDIRRVKRQKNVYVYGFSDLARRIDDCKKHYENLQPYLDKKMTKFRRKYLVNVVLGCTHFNYIKPQIETALKTRVDFYESSESVAIYCEKLLKAIGKKSRKKALGKTLEITDIN